MKAATLWTAIILTTAISFGIGVAFGSRSHFEGLSIAKFFADWQSLIGALAAIFTMGATLQAGRWALTGAREQIRASEEEYKIRDENRYRSTRALVLISLDKIVQYSINSLKYIYADGATTDAPSLPDNVIFNLASLIEASRPESTKQAKSLIGDIQLVQTYTFDIHHEKHKVGNVTQMAALHCLILYARCTKWYNYARGEEETIENEVSYEDIDSAIHILRVRSDLNIFHEYYELSDLKFTINNHFKRHVPEREPSGADDLS